MDKSTLNKSLSPVCHRAIHTRARTHTHTHTRTPAPARTRKHKHIKGSCILNVQAYIFCSELEHIIAKEKILLYNINNITNK